TTSASNSEMHSSFAEIQSDSHFLENSIYQNTAQLIISYLKMKKMVLLNMVTPLKFRLLKVKKMILNVVTLLKFRLIIISYLKMKKMVLNVIMVLLKIDNRFSESEEND
ncbi:hypothetical protein L9F63_026132, partial [Diploptera punctata]